MTGSTNGADRLDIGADSAEGQKRQGELPPEQELHMRIAADGTWYYRGTPIKRKELAKLFATVLKRGEDGSYWLITPAERGRVEVEDAPFVAVDCEAEGEGRDQTLRFVTNLDQTVVAGPEHPLRLVEDRESGETRPYLTVRPGLEALIARPLFYRLADLAVPAPEDPKTVGLWSGGSFFPLGKAA